MEKLRQFLREVECRCPQGFPRLGRMQPQLPWFRAGLSPWAGLDFREPESGLDTPEVSSHQTCWDAMRFMR